MRAHWGWLWRWLKPLLAVLIVGCVGVQFARLLGQPEVWQAADRLEPAALLAAAGGYLLALTCWGGYWLRLLARQGQPVPLGPGLRAYYVSQVGKYVPGKAWTLLLRAGLVRGYGVSLGAAILAGFYETLTAMAAGALLAAVLLPLVSGSGQLGQQALVLLAVAGVPILPGVFNRLVARLAKPFRPADAPPLPRISTLTLLGGLGQSLLGWAALGAGLTLIVAGLVPAGLSQLQSSAGLALRCTAYLALAYVAGFLVLPAPGGLGVRELILQQTLAAELAAAYDSPTAQGLAALVALALRAVWTVAEVALAGLAYCCYAGPRPPAPQPSQATPAPCPTADPPAEASA
jgi:uncharacterized membrane protein YbhN (UPF0104 family)